MAIGKYMSLEDARKKGNLDRFMKVHESTGDENAFLGIVDRMVKKPESACQTLNSKRPDED